MCSDIAERKISLLDKERRFLPMVLTELTNTMKLCECKSSQRGAGTTNSEMMTCLLKGRKFTTNRNFK
jgi:hypothetical protein